MSVASSIDLKFGRPVTPLAMIKRLLESNWSLSFNGELTYLPPGDDGMFSWISQSDDCIDNVMQELTAKSQAKELVGLVVTCENSGGEFLFYQDGTLSLIISVNRRTLHTNSRVTDVSWYLDKLLRTFNNSEFPIESLSWNEHL